MRLHTVLKAAFLSLAVVGGASHAQLRQDVEPQGYIYFNKSFGAMKPVRNNFQYGMSLDYTRPADVEALYSFPTLLKVGFTDDKLDHFAVSGMNFVQTQYKLNADGTVTPFKALDWLAVALGAVAVYGAYSLATEKDETTATPPPV